jgi:hypothetical protein
MTSVLPLQTFIVSLEEAAGPKSKWLDSQMELLSTWVSELKNSSMYESLKAALHPCLTRRPLFKEDLGQMLKHLMDGLRERRYREKALYSE